MAVIKEVFQTIDAALKADPSRAQGIQAVYQFNISGEEAGTYQVILRANEGFAVEGVQETPDCTLSIDSEAFNRMVEGRLSGTEAFMNGQLKIEGDMGLALRLNDVIAAYRNTQAQQS